MNHRLTIIRAALCACALFLLTLTTAGKARAEICWGKVCDASVCCSGHGTCTGFNECTCDTRYAGKECATIASCGNSSCPANCHGNGLCGNPSIVATSGTCSATGVSLTCTADTTGFLTLCTGTGVPTSDGTSVICTMNDVAGTCTHLLTSTDGTCNWTGAAKTTGTCTNDAGLSLTCTAVDGKLTANCTGTGVPASSTATAKNCALNGVAGTCAYSSSTACIWTGAAGTATGANLAGACLCKKGYGGPCCETEIISPWPTALNFDGIVVGSSSLARSLTFTNQILASSASISAIALTGANPGDFTLGGTCAAGGSVAAAGCTVDVTFTPTATGSRSATLSVAVTEAETGVCGDLKCTASSGITSCTGTSVPAAAGETVSCTLNGVAGTCAYASASKCLWTGGGMTSSLTGAGIAAPSAALAPAALDFGRVTVGATDSASFAVTLTNPSASTAMTIGTVTLSGGNSADFTLGSRTCGDGGALAAASSCAVPVTFTPTAAGSRSATLTVTTTSPVATLTTTLTGAGVISTDSVVIDPVTSTTLYAGLNGAGVYKSMDNGVNWTAATKQPANTRIKAVVIDKSDTTKLYAATYGGGVFASADSGVNWSACANNGLTNLNLVSLVIDASGKLYAGTEAGVFVSNDGCATWTAMNGGLP